MEIIAALSKYHQSFREARHAPKLDARQCKGNPEAKITVVEYADFECPFCGAARAMLEQFAEQNAAKVRFCYAPFPLQMHPNALTAGQAALFARDHGKFWELHTLMFEHQDDLSPAAVRKLAESIGLDGAALAKAVSSGKYLDELEASKAAGKEAGVTGTPSLLVNGRRFTLGISNESAHPHRRRRARVARRRPGLGAGLAMAPRFKLDARGSLLPDGADAQQATAGRAGTYELLPTGPDWLCLFRAPQGVGKGGPSPRVVLSGDAAGFPISDLIAFLSPVALDRHGAGARAERRALAQHARRRGPRRVERRPERPARRGARPARPPHRAAARRGPPRQPALEGRPRARRHRA